jgi:glutathione S-transferase
VITVYGFGRVNAAVVGLTRDLRVLWALEEIGLSYRVHGLDHTAGEASAPDYRRISPFEQIPVIDDDGFILAETGAVLLYLAEKSGKLIPSDFKGRTTVTRWCFAALNTIEPPLFQIAMIDLMGKSDPTGAARRPDVVKWAERALASAEAWLAERAYLTGDEFTVADILLVTVLREVRKTDLLAACPRIRAYAARCEARPAWQRTLDDYERRLGAAPGSAR